MSGSATFATARFRFATAATRISAIRTSAARAGAVDASSGACASAAASGTALGAGSLTVAPLSRYAGPATSSRWDEPPEAHATVIHMAKTVPTREVVLLAEAARLSRSRGPRYARYSAVDMGRGGESPRRPGFLRVSPSGLPAPSHAPRSAPGNSAGSSQHLTPPSRAYVSRRSRRWGLLHSVLLLRLFGRQQSDLHEIERADELGSQAEAAGSHDRVAERHRPVMLDEKQRCSGVVGDVLEHIPRLRVVEHFDAFLGRHFGPDLGACLHALLTLDPEADERGDLAPHLARLT